MTTEALSAHDCLLLAGMSVIMMWSSEGEGEGSRGLAFDLFKYNPPLSMEFYQIKRGVFFRPQKGWSLIGLVFI